MDSATDITGTVSRFVAGLRLEALPPEVVTVPSLSEASAYSPESQS